LLSLLVLCALAWIYLANGAGMGSNDAMAMDGAMAGMARPGFLLVLLMWWVMMLAMMLPSAAPAILLYERVQERAVDQDAAAAIGPAMVFASGYLLCWLLFAIAAATIELQLEAGALIEPERLGIRDPRAIGVILLAAGLYQLSPLKAVCLRHCRAPASFFARHWRPGWTGALRLGVRHGLFCVACCWALMLLLFAGGVMNLAWVAVLTVFVLVEKLLPHGQIVARISGVLLAGAGVALLLFGRLF
jgi:predicted metal-binding membrane protein